MKKLGFLLTLLVLLAAVAPVFAQSNSKDDSGFYYINVSIEKVYLSNEGYLILYRKQEGLGTLGIPNKWFNETAGKADYVFLPGGSNWPTMSLFYENGEFSHVRLYLHRNKDHSSWGHIPHGKDVSQYFTDGDSLSLEF